MTDLLEVRPIVFTAQSKHFFYCCDVVCEYVFKSGCIPLNPFRAFGYFLGDRVDRNDVRVGNNNLIRLADELWVFGTSIADGVLFEIEYARDLGRNVRLFTVGNRLTDIHEVTVDHLQFENQLIQLTRQRIGSMSLSPTEFLKATVRGEKPEQPRLFDPE